MAQYLLSVFHTGDYPEPAPEVMERMYAQVGAFNDSLGEQLVFGCGLQPRSTARTVRVADGTARVEDAPYDGGAVQLGGFWVVEAANDEEALELCRRGALACEGDVELRPLQGG